MLQAGSGARELAEKLAKAETEIKELRKKPPAVEELTKLRKTVKQLKDEKAEVGNKLAEADLQLENLKDFQKAFSKIFPQPFKGRESLAELSDATSEIGLQQTTTIVSVPKAVKHAEVSDETLRGKILTLAKTGFFDNWPGLGDIHKALIEKFGWTIAKGSLSAELNRMVKAFLLGVKKDPRRKQKVYRLAESVQFKRGG